MSHETFFLSADGRTQIAAPMTEEVNRKAWGRMTYSNRAFNFAELVETEDVISWIEVQHAYRRAESLASYQASFDRIRAAKAEDAARARGIAA
tara:strand:- start:5170 stop:5448 length:279 start_codon:yes stop_codon:yes gene_type:complete